MIPQTINSHKITWTIHLGSSYDEDSDCLESYCADGDGLVSISKRKSGQYDVFDDIPTDEPVATFNTLEEALAKGEELLLKYYPEVFEECRHLEEEGETQEEEEERQALRAIMR